MAGYSGKPLAEKLGIKPNAEVTLVNAPANYRKLLGKLPAGVKFSESNEFVHLFTKRRRDLEKAIVDLAQEHCRYRDCLGLVAEEIRWRCDGHH